MRFREISPEKLSVMANFRNILVHAYLNIHRAIVYDNLQEIDDFREFQRYILTYLSTQKGEVTP